MRRTITAVVVLVAFVTCAANAFAQHCRTPMPYDPLRVGLRVGLAAEFATYRTTSAQGEYQGLAVELGWEHPWLRLRGAMPAYRLVRNGEDVYGPGDLLLDAQVPFARMQNERMLAGGVGLAATAPTGNATDSLGMGHPMVMPGLWVTWRSERAFLSARIAYGRVFAAEATHSHHSAAAYGPLVNPMNRSEVELTLSVSAALTEQLHLRGGLYGAVPVAATGGVARTVGFTAADLLIAGRFDLSLEAQLPLAGDPFLAKVILQAGARF